MPSGRLGFAVPQRTRARHLHEVALRAAKSPMHVMTWVRDRRSVAEPLARKLSDGWTTSSGVRSPRKAAGRAAIAVNDRGSGRQRKMEEGLGKIRIEAPIRKL